jgi:23S rRNA pseudouridine1911/1915/1917 synthase
MSAGPRVVHVDDWLAVVDKPAGLVVHGAPGHRGPTLVDALGDLLGGGEPQRPGIVHRLDRDTSGLMIVARSSESHRRLAAMIKARQIRREYLALVEGRLRSRQGTIDAPLGRDHRAPERRAVGGRGARQARTHFRVREVLPDDTLVEARLETGRTHQLRAHFAAIGHPLCGDPRYGHAGRHGLRRQFLHSTRLALRHPATGEELELTSALPDDLEAALERARGSPAQKPPDL